MITNWKGLIKITENVIYNHWLLIFRLVGEEITFVRTGTHSDLF